MFVHSSAYMRLTVDTSGKLVWDCGPLSTVSTSQWSETIPLLSVWQPSPAPCCSVLIFPSLGTVDPMFTPGTRGVGGFSSVPIMPFCIPEAVVCRPAMRPRAHSTTHCVGTSWVDLLDVKIRHLLFNKVCSTLIPRLHKITSDFCQQGRSWQFLEQEIYTQVKHLKWWLHWLDSTEQPVSPDWFFFFTGCSSGSGSCGHSVAPEEAPVKVSDSTEGLLADKRGVNSSVSSSPRGAGMTDH